MTTDHSKPEDIDYADFIGVDADYDGLDDNQLHNFVRKSRAAVRAAANPKAAKVTTRKLAEMLEQLDSATEALKRRNARMILDDFIGGEGDTPT